MLFFNLLFDTFVWKNIFINEVFVNIFYVYTLRLHPVFVWIIYIFIDVFSLHT